MTDSLVPINARVNSTLASDLDMIATVRNLSLSMMYRQALESFVAQHITAGTVTSTRFGYDWQFCRQPKSVMTNTRVEQQTATAIELIKQKHGICQSDVIRRAYVEYVNETTLSDAEITAFERRVIDQLYAVSRWRTRRVLATEQPRSNKPLAGTLYEALGLAEDSVRTTFA